MNEKVKLPKEVAEAIELLKAQGMPLHEIGVKKATSNLPEVKGWSDLMKVPNDKLFAALYYGYEVEMTPEERIKWAISNAGDAAPIDSDTAYIHGIKLALEIYNIKISGVNAG